MTTHTSIHTQCCMDLEEKAKKQCSKEACDIQWCLQKNHYQQNHCQQHIDRLIKCCQRLNPDIVKHSVHCSGVSAKKGQPSNDNSRQRALFTYLLQNPWITVQFAMQSITLICSVLFFFMGLGVSMASAYRLYLNVMLTSFIAFGVKFYLRLKQSQVSVVSRAFLQFFPTEDSAHYLIYTLLFYNQPPTTIFVIPMFLYSVLNTVKFMQNIVQFLPKFTHNFVNILLKSVASKQADVHRFIAFCEVFSFVVLVVKVFTGGVFILAPFLYYQFIKLRYVSRRNPSVRTVFSELNMASMYVANHPKCPAAVSNVIRKVVGFVSQLNPYIVPTTTNPPPNAGR